MREGSPAFSGAIREEEQDLAAYLRTIAQQQQLMLDTMHCAAVCMLMDLCMCVRAEYTGPPDPVYGDERYRRIRVAAQVRALGLSP